MDSVNLWIALWAGIASFISPCCLPLYPSFLSYITGISVSELKSGRTSAQVRRQTMLHTLSFIVGFSIIFYALGLTAGFVGNFFIDYRDLLRQIAALLIFVMGLFLLGIFQPQWLMKERKLSIKFRPAGYVGSVFVGMGFAAGWSPCVGPILSAILALASNRTGYMVSINNILFTWLCNSFFRAFLFYWFNQMDLALFQYYYENWRGLDDRYRRFSLYR